MHNWLGPNRVIKKLSLVHFTLRTISNKNWVAFSCNASGIKPFVDPNLRPIDPPPFDDPDELYLDKSDIPRDCFEPNNPLHGEKNPVDIGFNPVGKQTTVPPQSREKKESNTETDEKRQRNKFKMKKNQLRKQLLSTMKLC